MSQNSLLEVNELYVNYGKLAVLFDISLKINTSEVVFLVGRNGAGKTTLFRTIAGFLEPREGEVTFKGDVISGMGAYKIARKGVKYIHQDKSVFGDLTIKENLELSSYATGDYDWEPVFAMFPKLKILLDRKAGKLSGGEKQMLLMGMAIIGKPDLVMMDEPTEGLAPHVIQDLAVSFKEISKTTTLFIVEQNLPIIADIADRVYCMREGKIIVEEGCREDIQDLCFEKHL
ncbi:MAG: ABC transporter ATP-binding protein [Spirochaetales bacterium]|uniref:ABC transporter ATP-binding protein n=1 Tax=Candidatus Thalassospirochaeta sargassi TaxID=3119039 RepID=A0AAJ1IE61_9SPIO|nr:ABC transporter ATP-binding protein [Spirochaetales bacterium]